MNLSYYSLKMIKEKETIYSGGNIKGPADVTKLVAFLGLEEEPEEVSVLITLTVKNRVSGIFEVSRGSLSAAMVHPREVYKRALINNACSIIFIHNHPSGDPEPSKEDISITKRLKSAGEVLGVKLLDHIIVGDFCLSFSGRGLL